MVSPEFRALTDASASAPGLPCPDCGYDLRGNRSGVCPECGLRLTSSAYRRAAAKRDRKVSDSPYFAPGMVLAVSLPVGLGIAALLGALDPGSLGVLGEMAYFVGAVVVSVVAGWVVFFGASAMWIGWSQTLPVTMVQTAAAFTAYACIAMVLDLVPIPLLPWLAQVLCLLGLLSSLLDIDTRDAIIVAFVSWLLQMLLVIVVIAVVMSAFGG